MLLKSPAIKPGLRLIQRLAYLSSMTFWLFPLPRMIFMLAPLLHIFFDVKIFVSSIDEAIAYTATYIVVNLMLQNYLYGRVRWPWMSELYEYVQGVFLTKAILSVLTSPRKPTFNVTAKGQSLDHDHLSRLAPPFVIIFAILAIGVLTAGYRYMFEPGVTSLMLVVGLWTLVNLVIAGAALGAVAERKQTDRFPRLPIQRTAELSVGSRAINVTVENVSAGGCAAAFDVADGDNTSLQWGAVGELRVKPLDGCLASAPLPVRIVRSEPGAPLGLAFKGLSYHDYSSLADLMYGDAAAIANFLERRRGHMDLFRGTVQFLIWSVEGPFRVARLALAYRLFGAVAPPVVMSSSATHAVEPQLISVVSAPDTSIQLLSGDTGHPGQLPLTADQGEPTVDRPGEWANLVLKLAAAEPASINTQIGKTDRTLQVA